MGVAKKVRICPYKALGLSLAITSLVFKSRECTNATMLTFTQLIILLFWTSIGSADAEKLFHNRDHSDVQALSSHQAEVITDTYTAEVIACSLLVFPVY